MFGTLSKSILLLTASTIAAILASGQSLSDPIPSQGNSSEIIRLATNTIRTINAPEADQGAAVDAKHLYAIDNSVIAKYRKQNGQLVARWICGEACPIEHLNSCFAEVGELWCANSNYSETPMASSIERFAAADLSHIGSHSLGIMDEGSLTWFDRYEGGWLAGFAHYDGEDGGLAYKGHRFTGVVTFDAQWRRTGGWMLPNSVLDRLAPDAASGGQVGPDGLLYILGHDKPEMYVLAKPKMGPKLVHLATLDIALEGQAFSWDLNLPRTIYGINRRDGLLIEVEIPEIPMHHPNAIPLR
ncbi:MAG: hypothetical protein AAFN06_13080 [Pseudomonadota bacterium]